MNQIPSDYRRYMRVSTLTVSGLLLLLASIAVISVAVGAISIPTPRVFSILFSPGGTTREHAVVMGIRLPQVLTAITAGGALALAGAVMQIILQNPLGSPFTLGISNAAAFGAAFWVLFYHAGLSATSWAVYGTTAAAFLSSMVAAAVILLISHVKKSSPEVMVLAGVALSSLFQAGTMLLQYFADDVQLSAMVFWTFGDTARAGWGELRIMAAALGLVGFYFLFHRWSLHAMLLGDETARGLGVPVTRVRLVGMACASLVTAVTIAFVGVIGFIGLAAPHITRRLLGDGNRWFLVGTIVTGSTLLAASDLVARLIIAPRVLPAAIVTAFLGAPVFIYLLVRGYTR
ncbi:MAG: FecCD family ABC transporter permease [Spirochaetota bacterium]